MKAIGGVIFVLGVLILLTTLLTKYGNTDWSLLGCLMMPGGILVGYLGSQSRRGT